MRNAATWRFKGPSDSACNRCYDWLRRGVNRRLAAFLTSKLPGDFVASPPVGADAPRRRAVVLEAGSGSAFATSVMADRPEVARSVCLDLDIEAVRCAKNRDPGVSAVVGDLRRLPFADGAFTLVFNSSTVEHLDGPVQALREMRRVCADDGRVFVGVPYARGPLGFQPLIGRTRVGVWLGRVFTRSSLDLLLHRAGLSPTHHLRYFWYFFIGALATKRVTAPHGEPKA